MLIFQEKINKFVKILQIYHIITITKEMQPFIYSHTIVSKCPNLSVHLLEVLTMCHMCYSYISQVQLTIEVSTHIRRENLTLNVSMNKNLLTLESSLIPFSTTLMVYRVYKVCKITGTYFNTFQREQNFSFFKLFFFSAC